MRKLLNDIRLGFGNAVSLYRLFMINIVVFVVIQFAKLIFYFMGDDAAYLLELAHYLSVPAALSDLLTQPWSLITYMFLHFNLLHIFFNMLVLYWTGKLFTEYLGNARLWATYILGGLTGAALYIIIYNITPAFRESLPYGRLLGASAGVIAIMVGIATLLPDYTVRLLLFGNVRLKYIAIVSILIYAISIPNGNAGGNIAHLGGALFGFIMVKQLRSGRDLTAWLSGGMRKTMHKVAAKRSRETEADYHERRYSRQEVIDRILDKISRSGYASLTAEEKEILFRASKNIRE